MLSVLGAIADLIVLAVLVFLGRLLGLGSGASQIALLWSKVTGLVTPLLSPLTWIVVALPRPSSCWATPPSDAPTGRLSGDAS